MKSTIFFISIAVIALFSLSLTSCEQEAINDGVPSEEPQISSKTTDNSYLFFPNIDEFLGYFDALYYEGDVYTLEKHPEGISYDQETNYTTTGKHDFESKKKLEFARWCDEQLSKGKKLTIGKEPDGTYWTDIKK